MRKMTALIERAHLSATLGVRQRGRGDAAVRAFRCYGWAGACGGPRGKKGSGPMVQVRPSGPEPREGVRER